MKRFIYSLLFLASLTVVSCAKQEVRPTKDTDGSCTPAWRVSETGNTSGNGSVVVLEGEGILDPNDHEVITTEEVIDINGILDPNEKKGKQ